MAGQSYVLVCKAGGCIADDGTTQPAGTALNRATWAGTPTTPPQADRQWVADTGQTLYVPPSPTLASLAAVGAVPSFQNGQLVFTYPDGSTVNAGSVYGISTFVATKNVALPASVLTAGSSTRAVPVADTKGNQPQPGDLCVVAVAAGSALPSNVIITGCSVTSIGQVTVNFSATVAVNITASAVMLNFSWWRPPQ